MHWRPPLHLGWQIGLASTGQAVLSYGCDSKSRRRAHHCVRRGRVVDGPVWGLHAHPRSGRGSGAQLYQPPLGTDGPHRSQVVAAGVSGTPGRPDPHSDRRGHAAARTRLARDATDPGAGAAHGDTRVCRRRCGGRDAVPTPRFDQELLRQFRVVGPAGDDRPRRHAASRGLRLSLVRLVVQRRMDGHDLHPGRWSLPLRASVRRRVEIVDRRNPGGR